MDHATLHGRFTFSEVKEYARSAFIAILANKVRSTLSILGILIGVCAVITMLAMGKGAQKSIEQRLSSLGSNLLMLRPGSPSTRGVQGAQGTYSRLTLDDVTAISKIGTVKSVDGNVSGSAQVVYGDKNVNTQVTGALPVYASMRASDPYFGRFYTEQENASQTRVALLGQTVVSKLFGEQNPVGQTVKVNRINFLVIGVLPLKGSTGFRDQDDVIILPLATAMNRVLGSVYLNSISIECTSPDVIDSTMDAVRNLMRKRHHLPAFKDDDFDIRNMADIQSAMAATTQTFSLLLGIVAAISLLVGGIGIMNIMLVSVSERTREIGLRKAVGAARRAIRTQFLIESATLSTMGGLIGIILGVGISMIMSAWAGWSALVTTSSILLAFIFSCTVGVVFGLWPANKASKLSPIEALRYE